MGARDVRPFELGSLPCSRYSDTHLNPRNFRVPLRVVVMPSQLVILGTPVNFSISKTLLTQGRAILFYNNYIISVTQSGPFQRSVIPRLKPTKRHKGPHLPTRPLFSGWVSLAS